MTTIAQKAAYVRGARRVARHFCHWPGCERAVKPAMWGCKTHWYKLPPAIRRRIWQAYRPGQEITKTPSPEYLAAVREARAWIAAHDGRQGRLL